MKKVTLIGLCLKRNIATMASCCEACKVQDVIFSTITIECLLTYLYERNGRLSLKTTVRAQSDPSCVEIICEKACEKKLIRSKHNSSVWREAHILHSDNATKIFWSTANNELSINIPERKQCWLINKVARIGWAVKEMFRVKSVWKNAENILL